jgi:HNH endonuclease
MTENIPQHLTKMMLKESYKSLGHFIYCLAPQSDALLTDEHIIPESIGGRLVFESASCGNCCKETHAFEGHACDIYRPIRRQLNFPSKLKGRRGRERDAKERFLVDVDYGRIKVPANEFPAYCLALSSRLRLYFSVYLHAMTLLQVAFMLSNWLLILEVG